MTAWRVPVTRQKSLMLLAAALASWAYLGR